jgi:hypothetical protein
MARQVIGAALPVSALQGQGGRLAGHIRRVMFDPVRSVVDSSINWADLSAIFHRIGGSRFRAPLAGDGPAR